MRALTITIPVGSTEISELNALVVEPDADQDIRSVLLFLHGMGEAGSSSGELPKVCIYQTPPFQAMLGHLPRTIVIAPQAPPVPDIGNWNWRDYITGLAKFLADRYAKWPIVATGFSRGGLGVLQLISAYPDLVQAWAVIDPQPARDPEETNAILPSRAMSANGWVRYGEYRNRSDAWSNFSSKLFESLPGENWGTAELSHVEMASQGYLGSPLASGAIKKNVYESLGVQFNFDHSTARTV
jgi:pimeloyl-ACP methyl ester carboxylesterase